MNDQSVAMTQGARYQTPISLYYMDASIQSLGVAWAERPHISLYLYSILHSAAYILILRYQYLFFTCKLFTDLKQYRHKHTCLLTVIKIVMTFIYMTNIAATRWSRWEKCRSQDNNIGPYIDRSLCALYTYNIHMYHTVVKLKCCPLVHNTPPCWPRSQVGYTYSIHQVRGTKVSPLWPLTSYRDTRSSGRDEEGSEGSGPCPCWHLATAQDTCFQILVLSPTQKGAAILSSGHRGTVPGDQGGAWRRDGALLVGVKTPSHLPCLHLDTPVHTGGHNLPV